MNASTRLARAVAKQIIEAGISDVVISPGSRSAPLAIAFYEAQRAELLTLHIRIDERAAGFFALGIAKASQRPVVLLCTSGTAAGNYLPAILEARHSQIPLLVITADRPARLRNTGANQTTDQVNMFGSATQVFADISDSDEKLSPFLHGLSSGPVHINLQFEEPLLPDETSDWCEGVYRGSYTKENDSARANLPLDSPRGVVVIGHDRAGFSPSEIGNFASDVGWPVISEDPLSFPDSVAHASLFLSAEKIRKALRPDVVIVIGRTTLSRSTNSFVKTAGKEIIVDPRIEGVDRNRSADVRLTRLPRVKCNFSVDTNWRDEWEGFSNRTEQIIELLADWTEPSIQRKVSEILPEGATVFIASSRPVRDIEAFVTPRSGLEVFANRGLAGIDGNISTALGIASQRKSTFAVLGDLSFLHDLNGILGADYIDLRILVINNDGGGIFSTLPQAGVEGFEKIFGTPHGQNLVKIGLAFGIPTKSVKSIDELECEMVQPNSGLSILIADVPTREENAKMLMSLAEKIGAL